MNTSKTNDMVVESWSMSTSKMGSSMRVQYNFNYLEQMEQLILILTIDIVILAQVNSNTGKWMARVK